MVVYKYKQELCDHTQATEQQELYDHTQVCRVWQPGCVMPEICHIRALAHKHTHTHTHVPLKLSHAALMA